MTDLANSEKGHQSSVDCKTIRCPRICRHIAHAQLGEEGIEDALRKQLWNRLPTVCEFGELAEGPSLCSRDQLDFTRYGFVCQLGKKRSTILSEDYAAASG
jgi:hypothetical protein